MYGLPHSLRASHAADPEATESGQYACPEVGRNRTRRRSARNAAWRYRTYSKRTRVSLTGSAGVTGELFGAGESSVLFHLNPQVIAGGVG